MCDLCSRDKDELDLSIRRHRRIADDLRRVSKDYGLLANRIINPHSEEAKMIKIRVSGLIRELVFDWI